MPEQGNVDGAGNDPLKGTKFEGKTPAEIAAMYGELESKLGSQGSELGQLRGTVRQLMAEKTASAAPVEREPADKIEYRRMADDLIVNPEKVLPELARKIREDTRREVREEVTQRDSLRAQTDQFFRDNPGLERYREVVSVIGDRVYQAHPELSYPEVLAEAKRQSTVYIADLRKRLDEDKADEKRKRAAITTSGGVSREGAAAADESGETPPEETDENRAAVLAEIDALKSYRAPRMGTRRPAVK